jgi:hypothetical protein
MQAVVGALRQIAAQSDRTVAPGDAVVVDAADLDRGQHFAICAKFGAQSLEPGLAQPEGW